MKNPKNKILFCPKIMLFCPKNAVLWKRFAGKGKSPETRMVTGLFGGELGIRTLGSLREHSISSAAPSTTRTTLRVLLSLKFCEKPKGRIAGQNSKIFNFWTEQKLRKMGIFGWTKLTRKSTISSAAPSTTRTTLRVCNFAFLPKTFGKNWRKEQQNI